MTRQLYDMLVHPRNEILRLDDIEKVSCNYLCLGQLFLGLNSIVGALLTKPKLYAVLNFHILSKSTLFVCMVTCCFY